MRVLVYFMREIAQAIEADMKANGGLLTKEDLAQCKPVSNPPLSGTYRGYDIVTNQLPGGGLVIEMLNILENFDLKSMGRNSSLYIKTLRKR